MSRVNILDASWLAVESESTPMHVGSLQIFTLPENAPETFLRDLVAKMKEDCQAVSPWNKKLQNPGRLARLINPCWTKDDNIDLDYHVRHSALPKPGGQKELGILISRLHSNHIDFNHPLWECHVIEGLTNNRFALYLKMHHSLVDGISGVRLLQRILSKDPNEVSTMAPWSVAPKKKSSNSRITDDNIPTIQGAVLHALESLQQQASTLPKLVGAITRLVQASVYKRDELAGPFIGPPCSLNGRVAGARRFATQKYSLKTLREIAHQVDASMNDIVLYICGTALRRFLIEQNNLPAEPLTAGIPVNIRPADDNGTGTAISFMIASLATDIADPMERIETIKESTRVAKQHLQSLPRNALTQYTMLMMSPYILQLLTDMGGRMRPEFNVTISNVPGPDQPLYYEGAKLEAMYPLSLITHGGALNITCISYNGSLDFGYTACRDTLPSMQNLAIYSGEAFEELKQLVLKPNSGKETKSHKAQG